MSREIDVECARAMGIAVVIDYATINGKQVAISWWDGEKDNNNAQPIPSYSTDYAAARLLEDEIERRGLQAKYSNALYEIAYGAVSHDPANDELDLWLVIRATPEQKARAFLRVMPAENSVSHK